jgi:hypothetical protein
MQSLAEQPVDTALSAADAVEERAALSRVLESRHFARAPLLSSFLSYVCEAALGDQTVRLTEQEIGVRVFRRAHGYDPGDDNIVRNYARQLRRRLDSYYLHEGRIESLRIDVPKGGYVAVFRRHRPEAESLDNVPESMQGISSGDAVEANVVIETPPAAEPVSLVRPASRPRLWPYVVVSVLCGILLSVATAFAIRHWNGGRTRSPLHSLWSQIFQSDRDTVIVPADVGFVILQQLNNRTFTLAEYESWSTVEQYDHVYMSFLRAQKYTSMLDLDTVSRLQRLPEIVPNRFITRAAHNVSMDDLSSDNVVLLGSNYSNPWVEVFERDLNFHFINQPQQGRSWIENTHPLPGESAQYENTTRNITHETYGVVALLPNVSRSGHVLIVEGLDGPGTQAAVDLLFQGDILRPVLKRATRPDGTLGSFEVLLAATSLDTRATDTHILAERYYP